MTKVIRIGGVSWSEPLPARGYFGAPSAALEAGDVLFLPDLRFEVETHGGSAVYAVDPGQRRRTPATIRRRDAWAGPPRPAPTRRRSAVSSTASANRRRRWSADCCRRYRRIGWCGGRASFRPAEIAGRADDVAEGRHAAARGQLSGDAVRRPAHPARVQQREPRGARARRGASATTSRRSRAGSRRSCGCRCRASVTCSRWCA